MSSREIELLLGGLLPTMPPHATAGLLLSALAVAAAAADLLRTETDGLRLLRTKSASDSLMPPLLLLLPVPLPAKLLVEPPPAAGLLPNSPPLPAAVAAAEPAPLTGGSSAATPACDANLLLLLLVMLVGPAVPAEPSPLPPLSNDRVRGD
jgi:hypothetical protein